MKYLIKSLLNNGDHVHYVGKRGAKNEERSLDTLGAYPIVWAKKTVNIEGVEQEVLVAELFYQPTWKIVFENIDPSTVEDPAVFVKGTGANRQAYFSVNNALLLDGFFPRMVNIQIPARADENFTVVQKAKIIESAVAGLNIELPYKNIKNNVSTGEAYLTNILFTLRKYYGSIKDDVVVKNIDGVECICLQNLDKFTDRLTKVNSKQDIVDKLADQYPHALVKTFQKNGEDYHMVVINPEKRHEFDMAYINKALTIKKRVASKAAKAIENLQARLEEERVHALAPQLQVGQVPAANIVGQIIGQVNNVGLQQPQPQPPQILGTPVLRRGKKQPRLNNVNVQQSHNQHSSSSSSSSHASSSEEEQSSKQNNVSAAKRKKLSSQNNKSKLANKKSRSIFQPLQTMPPLSLPQGGINVNSSTTQPLNLTLRNYQPQHTPAVPNSTAIRSNTSQMVPPQQRGIFTSAMPAAYLQLQSQSLQPQSQMQHQTYPPHRQSQMQQQTYPPQYVQPQMQMQQQTYPPQHVQPQSQLQQQTYPPQHMQPQSQLHRQPQPSFQQQVLPLANSNTVMNTMLQMHNNSNVQQQVMQPPAAPVVSQLAQQGAGTSSPIAGGSLVPSWPFSPLSPPLSPVLPVSPSGAGAGNTLVTPPRKK